jgi:uncharacterized protein YidB (DUF937 family)
MGLLDDVGKLAGLAGGGGGTNALLLKALMGMLGGGGGSSLASAGSLAGMLSGFQNSGLGDVAASWVGRGANLPISPDQLTRGLGASHVKNLAQQAGMSESDAASALAGLLPTVVDKLTPNGALPQENELSGLLGSLSGLLK